MFKALAAIGFALLGLSGCSGKVDLQAVSQGSSLTPGTLDSSPYTLMALLPPPGGYKHLRVYIEGDGRAWATRSQPSIDPTPRVSLMARLAAGDRGPSAYLARPCQFVTSPGCNTDVWTSGRFNSSVIETMSAALDRLKSRFAVEQFELVGYSGGAAIALILAGSRNDVTQVQTIAGNLDPVKWAELMQLAPFSKPVTPLAFRDKLRALPQRHFIGLNDKVVPPQMLRVYTTQLQGNCLEVVETLATHDQGYDESWGARSNLPLVCETDPLR